METFLKTQREMAPEFVERMHKEIDGIRAGIETIICGIDISGSQLYTVNEYGIASCHNSIGFAAIGIGARHAESQFMYTKYIPTFPLAKALLVLAMAKQRAEIAPGVGHDTDWFNVSQLGGIRFLQTVDNDPIMAAIASACKRISEAENNLVAAEMVAIEKLITESPTRMPSSPMGHNQAQPKTQAAPAEMTTKVAPSPANEAVLNSEPVVKSKGKKPRSKHPKS